MEQLEESGASEEESEKPEANPPPIPPRSHSLSPSPNMTPFHTFRGGPADQLRTEDTTTANVKTSTPFLLEGRGGEKTAPPLPRLLNGIASNGELGEGEEATPSPPPPPLPAKSAARRRSSGGPKLQGIAEEEQMLMNELDLLEKLVDSKEASKEEKQEAAPQADRKQPEQRTGTTNPEQNEKA